MLVKHVLCNLHEFAMMRFTRRTYAVEQAHGYQIQSAYIGHINRAGGEFIHLQPALLHFTKFPRTRFVVISELTLNMKRGNVEQPLNSTRTVPQRSLIRCAALRQCQRAKISVVWLGYTKCQPHQCRIWRRTTLKLRTSRCKRGNQPPWCSMIRFHWQVPIFQS